MARAASAGATFPGLAGDAWRSLLLSSRAWGRLEEALDAGGRPCLFGLHGSLASLVAVLLAERRRGPLLLLVPGEEESRALAGDARRLSFEGAVLHVPADGEAARFEAAHRMAAPGPALIVASAAAAVDPLPTEEELARGEIRLSQGSDLGEEDLVAVLLEAGLEPESLVAREGAFARRGGIVDFFPAGRTLPLRVEFEDDRVADIRSFDPGSQLSVEVHREVACFLLPAAPVSRGGRLADRAPAGTLAILRDPAAFDQALRTHLARLDGAALENALASSEALRRLDAMPASRLRAPPGEGIDFGGQVVAPSGTTFDAAVETLLRVVRGKSLAGMGFESEAERDRFHSLLREAAERIPELARWLGRKPRGDPFLYAGGFHSPALGLALFNHGDLFAAPARPRRQGVQERPPGQPVDSFLSLKDGDYVVHVVHGIARYEGIARLRKGGAEQDHLVLRFRGDLLVHVPATKIDLVQKYVGGKGEAPELGRFGSGAFEKRKAVVRDAVRDLAAELLELQAMRARKPGIQHPKDSPWQHEFEAAFPYELTADQGKAIEEIKEDLESSRPMDRLICGDVGYGKTEVAMRAAFKVAMGNRQVAVLVPTTILAQQHLLTFRERMRDYPVAIEALSRFQTDSEHRRTLAGIASGAVDIVIGTHRLIQDDVKFKNLGLLVIDEEQRFGVVHKERLRRMRSDVDVLVMTATPIPRTLNQALLGIRDVSALSTPPSGRRGVVSAVVPFDEELIRRAVLKELDRGGQVYVVHNRVHSIEGFARRIRDLVPEARVIVGHGQMAERELESTMLQFIEGGADVLVATTIIESGLDIPKANTLIVDSAHLYGLAELHQLRGRVGREDAEAYAYFLLRPEDLPTEGAESRLRAIEEFSGLGAGFQIAMRDLEIRGAGNILGPEQSGHIATVGYELYCRLLKAAVDGLKGGSPAALEDAEMNVDFTAFIPGDYVADKRQRIGVYRELARCSSAEDFDRMVSGLRDRFGPPPAPVAEFILLSRIRSLLMAAEISRLDVLKGEGVLLTPRRFRRFVERMQVPPGVARILSDKTVLLPRREGFRSPGELLAFLEPVLGADLAGAGRPGPGCDPGPDW